MCLSKRLEKSSLALGVLAGALECTAVDEVEDHAVGELLAILIWNVGGAELGECVAFCYDFRVLWGFVSQRMESRDEHCLHYLTSRPRGPRCLVHR